jgi:hypothetical protein
MNVCLRTCEGTGHKVLNQAICQIPVKINMVNKDDQDRMMKAMPPVPQVEQDIQQGMRCLRTGVTGTGGCQWDPQYEPRDPNTTVIPRLNPAAGN